MTGVINMVINSTLNFENWMPLEKTCCIFPLGYPQQGYTKSEGRNLRIIDEQITPFFRKPFTWVFIHDRRKTLPPIAHTFKNFMIILCAQEFKYLLYFTVQAIGASGWQDFCILSCFRHNLTAIMIPKKIWRKKLPPEHKCWQSDFYLDLQNLV